MTTLLGWAALTDDRGVHRPSQTTVRVVKRPDLETSVADNPVAAVLHLLREAGVAMSATDIKAEARSRGGAAIDGLWRRVQPTVRWHPNVRFDRQARTYLWADESERPESSTHMPTAAEALAMLVKGGVRGESYRQTLGNVVRSGLAGPFDDSQRELGEQLETVRADLSRAHERTASLLKQLDELKAEREAGEGSPQDEYDRAAKRRATRDRHTRLVAIRALAELAAQVEELASIGTDSDIMIQYARSLVDSHGLEPIERAGGQASYDPSQHSPNGPAPKVGAAVLVIRPGYTWNAPGEAVLISKALVAQA
jgi:hypothetical protein